MMTSQKIGEEINMNQISVSVNKPVNSLVNKLNEELEGADLEMLCQLEKHLKCMKNRLKNNSQKKDKSKRKRKSKSSAVGLSQLCKQEEDIVLLKDVSNTGRLRNKIKKRTCIDFNQSYPVPKKCKIKYLCKNGVAMVSPVKMKTSKKKKQHSDSEIAKDQCLERQSKFSCNKLKRSGKHLKGLCEYVTKNTKQDVFIKQEGLNTDSAHNPEERAKQVAYKVPLFCSEKKSLPSIQLDEDNGTTAKMEAKTPSSLVKGVHFNQIPKQEDLCSVSDDSQELFITQKTFQPIQLSSSISYNAAPLSHKQFVNTLDCVQNNSHTDILHLSQASSSRVHGDSGSDISQCNLELVIKTSTSLIELATQTDDVFSYLSLKSCLKKTRAVDHCSEKPLDLSLPTRIRSTPEYSGIKSNNDDVFIVGVQYSTKAENPCVQDSKMSFSQLPKSQETKYIQTVLNTSYFFKTKGGENGKILKAPILKQDIKTKQKARKSPGLRNRKENYTVK